MKRKVLIMVCLIAAMTGGVQAQTVRLRQNEYLPAAMHRGHVRRAQLSAVMANNGITVADLRHLPVGKKINLSCCKGFASKEVRAESKRIFAEDFRNGQSIKAARAVNKTHTPAHQGVWRTPQSLQDKIVSQQADIQKLQNSPDIKTSEAEGPKEQLRKGESNAARTQQRLVKELAAQNSKHSISIVWILALIIITAIISSGITYKIVEYNRLPMRTSVELFERKFPLRIAEPLLIRNGKDFIWNPMFECPFKDQLQCHAVENYGTMARHIEQTHRADKLVSNGKPSMWNFSKRFNRWRRKKGNAHEETQNTTGGGVP